MTLPKYDVFISHASEDKADVARPLSMLLRDAGLNVWIDEAELLLGDSLRRKIDLGLRESRYGVVILSPSFFAKEWPQKELDALVAREDGRAKVILPVRHKVTALDVAQFSPLLADKLSANTATGLHGVAAKIVQAVKLAPTETGIGALQDDAQSPSSIRPPADSEAIPQVGPIRIDRLLSGFFDDLEATVQGAKPNGRLRTGFVDFDRAIGGLRLGELHVLGARPAMGATTLAMNVSEHVARFENRNVLYFSLKTRAHEILNRFTASIGRIEHRAVEAGTLSESDWHRFVDALTVIDTLPIFVDETPDMSASDVVMHCQQKASELGSLGLVVIDSHDLLSSYDASSSHDDSFRQLRLLARELNCAVLLVTSVSRSAEVRPSKRPLISDLRHAEAMHRNAFMTMFLYRDSYYNYESQPTEAIELIVAYHRGGPLATIKLMHRAKMSRLENVATGEVDGESPPF